MTVRGYLAPLLQINDCRWVLGSAQISTCSKVPRRCMRCSAKEMLSGDDIPRILMSLIGRLAVPPRA